MTWGYCIRCRRTVDLLVLGRWVPWWALCQDCAEEFEAEEQT